MLRAILYEHNSMMCSRDQGTLVILNQVWDFTRVLMIGDRGRHVKYAVVVIASLWYVGVKQIAVHYKNVRGPNSAPTSFPRLTLRRFPWIFEPKNRFSDPGVTSRNVNVDPLHTITMRHSIDPILWHLHLLRAQSYRWRAAPRFLPQKRYLDKFWC